MDETKEVMAVRFVLGELTGPEERRFREELERDRELREFARDMQETLASLALSVPPLMPQDDLPARIFQASPRPATRKVIRINFVPWTLAACLAIICGILTVAWRKADRESASLRERQARLQQEVAELRHQNILAQIRIATLQAQVNTFARTAAVVVWDAAGKTGVIQFQDLPAPQSGKTYQLWILDPKSPQPISAGLVPPSESGIVRVDLKPSRAVESAGKFAVSIENAGGAQTPEGPIVFIGQ